MKNYTLILYDTKNDGWNNNYLTIRTENDIILDNISLSYNDILNDINSKEYIFSIPNSAKFLLIEYHNIGFYSHENYYQLYSKNQMVYASEFGTTPQEVVCIDILNNKIIDDISQIIKPQIFYHQIINYANYNSGADWNGENGNVTTVGTNGGPSAYGTYDQTGNVYEWNDLNAGTGLRGIRGGYFGGGALGASSLYRLTTGASNEVISLGFRLASFSNPLGLPNFVTVGDVGNNADPNTGGLYGSVGYSYKINKYLITNNEYINFLNIIAKHDYYRLYKSNMGTDPRGGIIQSGISGNFTYSAKTNMGNKPVIYVSWFDCARYANWIHNGKPNDFSGDTQGSQAFLTLGTTTTNTGNINTAVTFTLNDVRSTAASSGYFVGLPALSTIGNWSIDTTNNSSLIFSHPTFGTFQSINIRTETNISSPSQSRTFLILGALTGGTLGAITPSPTLAIISLSLTQSGAAISSSVTLGLVSYLLSIETGAYTLNGRLTGNAVARNLVANYHVPTENEWYKAAYYKANGINVGYWKFATQNDSDPISVSANSVGDGILPFDMSHLVTTTTTTTTTTTLPSNPTPTQPPTLTPTPPTITVQSLVPTSTGLTTTTPITNITTSTLTPPKLESITTTTVTIIAPATTTTTTTTTFVTSGTTATISTQTPTETLTPTPTQPTQPPTPPPPEPPPTIPPTGEPWPCCETIETPSTISNSGDPVGPESFGGCLVNYVGNANPPWSEDAIDTLEDIVISDYSPCLTNNLEALSYGGSTSCDTFASLRECEAKYLVDTCGEAEEHQYIAGDVLKREFYVKCTRDDQINCWPLSHWKCPDCPSAAPCAESDPNFIGCITDTQQNRDKLGSTGCSFNGYLDGSTPCSVFENLKACLLTECEQKCGGGSCQENFTGFYALCDQGGSTSCIPQAFWSCCDIDKKSSCKSGTGVFSPSHIDVPLSVVGGTGNPSALTVRIPLVNQNPTTNNNFGTNGTIRIPSGINELSPPGSSYTILNINGTAPYTTGFEIKNIKVEFDNQTGKLKTSFDASLFYCEAGYAQNNNIYLCPPQNFDNEGLDNNCLDCNATKIIRG